MKYLPVFVLLFVCFLAACQEDKALKEVSFATVQFESDGCFGQDKCVLEIKTRGAESFAFLTCEGGKTSKVKVNGVQLLDFEQFVSELRKINGGGFCTTQSRYEVTYRSETFRKVDNGCSTEGFYRIKNAWFKQ